MKIWFSKQFALEEWRRRMVFWGGAIATGAVAVLFAKGSEYAMAVFFRAREAAAWWPYVAAPGGLALCAWLTKSVFKGAEGSGIPQTIAALAMPTERDRGLILVGRAASIAASGRCTGRSRSASCRRRRRMAGSDRGRRRSSS